MNCMKSYSLWIISLCVTISLRTPDVSFHILKVLYIYKCNWTFNTAYVFLKINFSNEWICNESFRSIWQDVTLFFLWKRSRIHDTCYLADFKHLWNLSALMALCLFTVNFTFLQSHFVLTILRKGWQINNKCLFALDTHSLWFDFNSSEIWPIFQIKRWELQFV